MSRNYKHLLIAWCTFLGGIYFFLEFVLPASALPETVAGYPFEKFHDGVLRGVQIVGAMAIGLGIINIVMVHGQNIARTRKGWGNSLALIASMFVVFAVQTISLIEANEAANERTKIESIILFLSQLETDARENNIDPAARIQTIKPYLNEILDSAEIPGTPLHSGATPSPIQSEKRVLYETAHALALTRLLQYEEAALPVLPAADDPQLQQARDALVIELKALAAATQELTIANSKERLTEKLDHFFFEAFFSPLGAAMFSLLAFYIASAAYRSFRIRSLEAFIMMIPAVIVMLGQIPHGSQYISEDLPDLRFWLLQNINAPAIRAITFGFLIASLAMAVRMWLSLEKSPLQSEETQGDEDE